MKRGIFGDFILNTIATALPLVMLQLFILPQLAGRMTGDAYGRTLFLFSLLIMVAGTPGSVLNNLRLITFLDYQRADTEGDFNFLLFVSLTADVVIMGLCSVLLINGTSLMVGGLVTFAAALYVLTSYLSVGFRLTLNYRKIVISSICLSVGYAAGYIGYLITGLWPVIFIFGYGLNLVYVLANTGLIKESSQKTILYRATRNRYLALLVSGFLVSMGAYVDKLLLFPILGGGAVAIYYTASLLPKTIAMAIEPTVGVLLSHFAHMQSFGRRQIILGFGALALFGAIGFIGISALSKPVLQFLYPQFVREAMQYVPITSSITIVGILCGMLNAVLLRFHDSKWQLYINSVYIGLYLLFSLFSVQRWGITGLCWGILIASLLRLCFMITLLLRNSPGEMKHFAKIR